MTGFRAIRSAIRPSLALAAILMALTPDASRAESPTIWSLERLSHDPNELAGRHELAASPDSSTTGFGQQVQSASEAGGETGSDSTLAENAWDFTDPDSIPGFASTPYPVRSKPEIAD